MLTFVFLCSPCEESTPVDLEILNFEPRTQHLKESSAFLRVGRCKSQGSLQLFSWCAPQLPGVYNPVFSYSELSQYSPQGVATVLWLLHSRYFSSGFTSLLWRAATPDGRKVSIFQKPSPLGQVSLIAQLVKNPPAMQETPVWFLGGGRSAGGGIGYPLQYSLASLVAQLVKYLTTMWETWVRSLGWGDPLEKRKATHSSILVWKIPWPQRVGHDWATLPFTSLSPLGQEFDQYLGDTSWSNCVPQCWETHSRSGEKFWKATLGAKFWTRPHQ